MGYFMWRRKSVFIYLCPLLPFLFSNSSPIHRWHIFRYLKMKSFEEKEAIMARFFSMIFFIALTFLSFSAACFADEDSQEEEPQWVTFAGSLRRLAAVGGETTGYGLRTNYGLIVELDLTTYGLQNQFREGRQIRVTGYFRTVHGVERPERQVLVVAHISSGMPYYAMPFYGLYPYGSRMGVVRFGNPLPIWRPYDYPY